MSVQLDDMGIEDPIYDHECWPEIKAKFPNATFEDASDEIHESRIVVKIADVTWREWFTFLLDSGWHEVSLLFQLSIKGDSDDSPFIKLIKDWIEAHPKKEVCDG